MSFAPRLYVNDSSLLRINGKADFIPRVQPLEQVGGGNAVAHFICGHEVLDLPASHHQAAFAGLDRGHGADILPDIPRMTITAMSLSRCSTGEPATAALGHNRLFWTPLV